MDEIAKDDANTLLETLCSKIASTSNHQRKELLTQITHLVGLEQSISRRQRQDQNPIQLLQSSKSIQQLEPLQNSEVGIADRPLPSQPPTSDLDSTSDPLSSSPSLSAILQNCSSKTDYDVRTILLRSVSKLLTESNSSSELFNQGDGFLDASASFQILVESLRTSLNPSKASTIASSSTNLDMDSSTTSISALKCAAASLKAIHSFFNSLSSSNSNDTNSTRSKLSSTLLLLQPQQVYDLVSLLLKASSTGLKLDPQSSSSSGRSSSLGHSDSGRGRRLSGNTTQRPSSLAGSGRIGGGIVGGGALGGFVSSSHSSSTSPQKASGSTSSLGKTTPSSPHKSQIVSQASPSLRSRSSNASLKETPSQMEGEIRHNEIDDEASSASEVESSQGLETGSESGFESSRGDSSARGEGDSGRRKRLLDASRGVRMNAIACLLSLNEHSPNQVYSHWTSLFPESSTSSGNVQSPSNAISRPSRFVPPSISSGSGSFSLFNLIERDPALSVRIAAAHAIEVILSKGNQKGWLAAAEERSTRVASFTSLSARLGSIVVGLRSKIATFLSTPPTGNTHSRSNSSVSTSSLGAGQNRTEKPTFHQPAALLEVVLRLAKTLVSSTSNAKLRQTHMEVLRQPVLGLCSHPEPSIAVAAYSLLSALISSPSGGTNGISGPASLSPSMQTSRAAAATSSLAQSDSLSDNASDVDSHAVQELLDQLSHKEASDIVSAQLWSTLATFAGNRRDALRPHESSSLELLESSFPSKSESVRQGAATFLLTFLRSQAEEVSSSIKHLPQASQAFHSVCHSSESSTEILSPPKESGDKSQILSRIVSLVKNDDSPIVRTLLADSLPYWDSVLRSSASVQGDVGTKTILSSLLRDQQAAVRAAAVRALGVILMDGLKHDSEKARRGESASSAISTLEFSLEALVRSSSTSSKGALEDEALLVQVRASWTLANLCEVYFSNRFYLVSSETSRNIWFRLLQAALSSSKKEERVSLNALRAFGALFGSMKSEWLDNSPDQELKSIRLLSTEAIERLCSVVWVNTTLQPSSGSSNQGGSPKLKWNAASSLGRALGSQEARSWMSEKQESNQKSLLSRTVLSLSSSLHSKTFKVKLASAHALLQLPIATWSDDSLISEETFQVARESCDLALEKIDDLIRSASFSEGNLHGEPTKAALNQLKDLLDESEGLRKR